MRLGSWGTDKFELLQLNSYNEVLCRKNQKRYNLAFTLRRSVWVLYIPGLKKPFLSQVFRSWGQWMLAHMEMAAFYFCWHHMKVAMQVLQIQEFEFHQWNVNLVWPGTCIFAEWLINHLNWSRMMSWILELGRLIAAAISIKIDVLILRTLNWAAWLPDIHWQW